MGTLVRPAIPLKSSSSYPQHFPKDENPTSHNRGQQWQLQPDFHVALDLQQLVFHSQLNPGLSASLDDLPVSGSCIKASLLAFVASTEASRMHLVQDDRSVQVNSTIRARSHANRP